MKKTNFLLGMAAMVLVWTGSNALAITCSIGNPLDVTASGACGDINGSKIFHVDLSESSGTGVFEPFVRIQGSADQKGVNTGAVFTPGDLFDTKTSHTTSLLLSQIPKVTIGGIHYLEFALDMGEPGNAGSPQSFLDIVEGQFFIAPSGTLLPTTFTGEILNVTGAPPKYRLDATTDKDIILMDDLNSGNGRIDYLWYIPADPFGSDGSQFVYFYSAYGRAGGSFEEWGTCRDPNNRNLPLSCAGRAGVPVDPPQVPEPSASILLGSGLLLLSSFARSRGPRP